MEKMFHIQNVYFFYYRMRYVYRMIRIVLFLKRKSKIYDSNIVIKVFLKVIPIFCVVAVTTTSIIIPIVLIVEQETYFNTTEFNVLCYSTTCRITSKGFGLVSNLPETVIFEYELLHSYFKYFYINQFLY